MEITGVAELLRVPPAEASSRELETALAGAVASGGNGLGRSSTPMPLFRPGATTTSSEELTCIALVGRIVSPSAPFGASFIETLEVPDAHVSIISDTTGVAGWRNTLTSVAVVVFAFHYSTPA